MLRTLAESLRREGKTREAADIEAVIKHSSEVTSQRKSSHLDQILDGGVEPWTASAAAAVDSAALLSQPVAAAREPWTESALSHFEEHQPMQRDELSQTASSLRNAPSPPRLLEGTEGEEARLALSHLDSRMGSVVASKDEEISRLREEADQSRRHQSERLEALYPALTAHATLTAHAFSGVARVATTGGRARYSSRRASTGFRTPPHRG